MQAFLCLAVSGQALNGSLSYTTTSKSSPPHFSPPPRFPHSHWLVVSSITSISLFKCHPWVGVLPGLPACLSVPSVAVLPSMKLLQASTLTGSFSRPLCFSRPRDTYSLSNSSWFSVLTSVEEATARRTRLLPCCASMHNPAPWTLCVFPKVYRHIYTYYFSVVFCVIHFWIHINATIMLVTLLLNKSWQPSYKSQMLRYFNLSSTSGFPHV